MLSTDLKFILNLIKFTFLLSNFVLQYPCSLFPKRLRRTQAPPILPESFFILLMIQYDIAVLITRHIQYIDGLDDCLDPENHWYKECPAQQS